MSKELKIVYGPFGFNVHYEGGGQVPDGLRGYYTSRPLAERAIAAYNKTKRVRKNASSVK